ncbi:MAG: hypothetical protein JF603_14600 [Acidobacteria bacterium]|nr:hypothetical protein [Acidobacteriota bacterium]
MLHRVVYRAFARRPLLALLAGTLSVLGVSTVGSTFATTVNGMGGLVPGAVVTDVVPVVDSGTTLFTVDLHYKISGLTCGGATPDVDLHYETITAQGGKSAFKTAVCTGGALTSGGTRDSTTGIIDVTVSRPVMNHQDGWAETWPNETIKAYGELRASGTLVNNSMADTQRSDGTYNTAFPVKMPSQPVWIGVGDGYTSTVNQLDSQCPLPTAPSTSPPLTCNINLNDTSASWVTTAVSQANAQFAVHDQWQIQPIYLADSATRAADFATDDNQTQLVRMRAALATRAPQQNSRQPGSWNWVGVTAGLLDAGVMDALLNPTTGWYYRNGNNPTGNRAPWDVAQNQLSACPTYPTMSAATTASITNGLLNVVKQAQLADPNVRIVHPLYPYWAEANGANSGYTNPCRPATVAAVDALDSAAALAGRTGVHGVVDVDWRRAFDPAPTGSGTGANRSGSVIQLSRPYGFPYLGPDGASQGGIVIVNAIVPSPPVVFYEYVRDGESITYDVRDQDDNGWFNQPLDIHWTGMDPNTGIVTDLGVTHIGPPEEGLTEWTSPDFCKTTASGDQMCAYAQTVDVNADFTAPRVIFSVNDSVATSTNITLTTGGDPTTSCDGVDDAGADPASGFTSCSVAATDTTFTDTTTTITYVVTAIDQVGNSGSVTYKVTVPGKPSDTIPPVIRDYPGVVAGTNYSSPPSVPSSGSCMSFATDAGGSLLKTCTFTTSSSRVVGSLLPTSTWNMVLKACDGAGNCTTKTETWTTLAVTPVLNGRMTGGGSVAGTGAGAHSGTEVLLGSPTPSPGATVAAGGLVGATYSDESPIATTGAYAPSIKVSDASGRPVAAVMKPFTVGAQTVLTAQLPLDIPVGTYTVVAKAWDTDQNKAGGDYDVLTWTVIVAPTGGTGDVTAVTGKVSTDLTLRCNGSPNQLSVKWGKSHFDLSWVSQIVCWNDPTVDPKKPAAPFDSLYGSGSGSLCIVNDDVKAKKAPCGTGTIEWVLVDAGEPGSHDTQHVVVKDATGKVVLDSSGTLTDGNLQAHEAEGKGTNNNGQVNGPNGHSGNEVLIISTSPVSGSTVSPGALISATYSDESPIATTGTFAPKVTLIGPGGPVQISLNPFTAAKMVTLTANLPASLSSTPGVYTVAFTVWDTDQNKAGGDFDTVTWTFTVRPSS